MRVKLVERKRILEEKTAIKIEKIRLNEIEAQKKREEKTIARLFFFFLPWAARLLFCST